LVIREIAQVFYAPHRVFKEIFRSPKFIGPLLILIIFIAAQTGAYYVRASNIYSEITLPTGQQADEWTENAVLWQASPSVVISSNHEDFINGTSLGSGSPDYYGNSSIEFSLNDSQAIQIALADLSGSVDCGETGFRNLTFRVKLVKPEVAPKNVTLILYSLSDSDYFRYDLTEEFSKIPSEVWNNMTIPVASTDWASSNSDAKWQNITSLMMELSWTDKTNVQMRIDGLFFRGIFKNGIEVQGTQAALLSFAMLATTSFLFQWLFLSAVIFLIVKGLKGKALWNQLMVAVGFASVTMIVQALILLATYSTLSPINVPLEYFGGVPNEFNPANQILLEAMKQENFITSASQVAIWIWTIGLGAFIVREVPVIGAIPADEGVGSPSQLSWLKCLGVSAASFALTIIVMGFLRL
jgi:hypothetical protein